MTVYLDGLEITSVRIYDISSGTRTQIFNSATFTQDIMHIINSQYCIQVFRYDNDLITGKPVLSEHKVIDTDNYGILYMVIINVSKAGSVGSDIIFGARKIKQFVITNTLNQSVITQSSDAPDNNISVKEYPHRLSIYYKGNSAGDTHITVEHRFISLDLDKYIGSIISY